MLGPLKRFRNRLLRRKRRRVGDPAEPPPLPWWRSPVPLRVAVVLVTTIGVAAIAALGTPPLPCRVGEVYPHDLCVRVDFQVINPVGLNNQSLRRERSTNGPAAEKGTSSQGGEPPIVVEKYTTDMVLVRRGDPISERELALLREEHEVYQRSRTRGDRIRYAAGQFLIFGLLAALVSLYVARFQVSLAQSLPTIIGVCGLVLCTLGLGFCLSHPPWHAAHIPLTMTAMVLTLAYNPQFALLMSVSLALGMTVMLGTNLEYLLQQLGGLSAAVLLSRNVRTRTQLVKVAVGAGAAFALMTLATGLLTDQTASMVVSDCCRHFLWGTLAGFVLTGLLPLVERSFGIVTDISLLELADGAHPLLQELVRRAPGTYTHSMTVANLAEAAAKAIAANPLLVRVGSYFHDIGKMLKPSYFIENQTGENLHDALEPALSTLVIIGHVKDGIALAQQHRLPRPIMDFIAQHHGTTLIEYFYREAMRLQGSPGAGSPELEASFRYPGPKPQSRESGILMLADAVESSSRTLLSPTPGSLRKLVHDLLMKRLLDGQFEQSGLTLTELHLIEDSLSKSLIALFHARIKYPEVLPLAKAG